MKIPLRRKKEVYCRKVDTRLSLSAPMEIKVALVRGDYISTSNVFRTFFEVFSSISSGLIGAVWAARPTNILHWAFLSVTCTASVVFLGLFIWFERRARSGE